MKITAQHVAFFGIGVVVGALVVILKFLIFPPLRPPKDTPIVILGACIHGNTAYDDDDGWTTDVDHREKSYKASLHPTPGVNPHGIDWIALSGFVASAPVPPPPSPAITGTQGWAITFSSYDQNGNPIPNSAKFCSDESCGASASDGHFQSHTKCSPLPSLGREVFYFAGNQKRFEEKKSGNKTRELHFHDQLCDGLNGNGEGNCDKIHDIQLEVCNGSYGPYTCQNGSCQVKIGLP